MKNLTLAALWVLVTLEMNKFLKNEVVPLSIWGILVNALMLRKK